jgi:hypothetical protein
MKLTIKQLMEIHEAMTQAMDFMDNNLGIVHGTGSSWGELNKARAIIRVAIESTGATVDIGQEAA